VDSNFVSHGFIRASNGMFTEFSPPGSLGTYVSDINLQGTVTGIYIPPIGLGAGFVRTADGQITSFGTTWASFGIGTINAAGAVTGYYYDSQLVSHGFVRDPNGDITDINAPGAGIGSNQGTFASANNDAGAVTGWYVDSDGVYHGFVGK